MQLVVRVDSTGPTASNGLALTEWKLGLLAFAAAD